MQDPPIGQPSGAGPTIWTTLRCRTHHLDNPQVQDPPLGQPPGAAGLTLWTTLPFGEPPGARPTLGATLRGKTTKHRTTLRYPFLLPVLAHPQVWTKGLTHPQVLPKRGWVGQPSGSCNSDPTLRLGTHPVEKPQVPPSGPPSGTTHRLEVPDNPQVSQKLLLRVARNQGKVDGNPSQFDSVANPQVLMFPLP